MSWWAQTFQVPKPGHMDKLEQIARMCLKAKTFNQPASSRGDDSYKNQVSVQIVWTAIYPAGITLQQSGRFLE